MTRLGINLNGEPLHAERVGELRFQSTQWSVVASAGDGCDSALAELCNAYWKPLYFHVRRMGYDAADAQDLTQTFFVRLLEKR